MIDITTCCFIFCNNFNKSCAFVGFNSAARIAVYWFKTSKTWLIYIPWYFGHRWLSQDMFILSSALCQPIYHSSSFRIHLFLFLYREFKCWGVVCVGVIQWLNGEAISVNMSCLGLKLWSNRKITFKPIYPRNQNVSPCIKRSRSHFTMLERAPLF